LHFNVFFSDKNVGCRVARWFVFKPKIQIWVNFGGSYNGKFWYILLPFGLFYCYWKYFMDIWYIFRRLGILHQEKSGNPGWLAGLFF
jgi:hypothetical protein